MKGEELKRLFELLKYAVFAASDANSGQSAMEEVVKDYPAIEKKYREALERRLNGRARTQLALDLEQLEAGLFSGA